MFFLIVDIVYYDASLMVFFLNKLAQNYKKFPLYGDRIALSYLMLKNNFVEDTSISTIYKSLHHEKSKSKSSSSYILTRKFH